MLNFKLIVTLLKPASVKNFLGIISIAGITAVADIILIIKISLILGPWITMSALSFISAVGIYFAYKSIEKINSEIIESIETGVYSPDLFYNYTASLLSAVLLILPGILNTISGIILSLPVFNRKTGRLISYSAGINWKEAYEFLRLESLSAENFKSSITG